MKSSNFNWAYFNVRIKQCHLIQYSYDDLKIPIKGYRERLGDGGVWELLEVVAIDSILRERLGEEGDWSVWVFSCCEGLCIGEDGVCGDRDRTGEEELRGGLECVGDDGVCKDRDRTGEDGIGGEWEINDDEWISDRERTGDAGDCDTCENIGELDDCGDLERTGEDGECGDLDLGERRGEGGGCKLRRHIQASLGRGELW